ncbi:MFS general substrate transporter [Macrolepiota fuliginosa MF-IS2]|uniref:MFS general substrate transporter n=1 Tax=Macrolepiota fuliginosa MF-IS2 TaxID=1400762 RepID=A0A9P5XMU4_9AGAR|nr:MFS general substrate transporter [Macrolepiota fuliginosa MF-IS2]
MADDEQATQLSEQIPLLSRSDEERTPSPLPLSQLAILSYPKLYEPGVIASAFVFWKLASLVDGDGSNMTHYMNIMNWARNVSSLVAVMYWGRMSDYIGRKPILLLGMAAMTMSMLFIGLSTTFWMLIASQCIYAGFNSNTAVINSPIGEMTDKTNRVDAFALLRIPWFIGIGIAYLILSLSPHLLWQYFPYLFLPCTITALLMFLGFLVISTCFHEVGSTNTPSQTIAAKKYPQTHTCEHTISSIESAPTNVQHSPLPLRALLTRPVILSVANYAFLFFTHMTFKTLHGRFLITPIPTGGLSLTPLQLIYILTLSELCTGLVYTLALGPSIRRFGLRAVARSTVLVFIPIFLLFPLMHIYAKGWQHQDEHTSSRNIMYILLVVQLALFAIADLGYGCMYMYITSSVPNKHSLGSVNGLAETAGLVAGLIGSMIVNVMFNTWAERGWIGGYSGYYLLCLSVLGGVVLIRTLPKNSWAADESD